MNIQEFLNKNKIIGLTKDVAVSNRISNENGIPLKFKIKTITAKEYDETRNKYTILNPVNNEYTVNTAGLYVALIIKCCVEPNFKSKENIDAVGAITPEDYVNMVLLPGEIDSLASKISEVNEYKPFNYLVEEAKN